MPRDALCATFLLLKDGPDYIYNNSLALSRMGGGGSVLYDNVCSTSNNTDQSPEDLRNLNDDRGVHNPTFLNPLCLVSPNLSLQHCRLAAGAVSADMLMT